MRELSYYYDNQNPHSRRQLRKIPISIRELLVKSEKSEEFLRNFLNSEIGVLRINEIYQECEGDFGEHILVIQILDNKVKCTLQEYLQKTT